MPKEVYEKEKMCVHAAEDAGSSAEIEYCSLCWVSQTLFTPRGQARRPLKGQKGDGVFLVVANRPREWSQTAIWGGPKTWPANKVDPTSQQDGLQGDAGRLRTQRGQRNQYCTPREWSIPGAPVCVTAAGAVVSQATPFEFKFSSLRHCSYDGIPSPTLCNASVSVRSTVDLLDGFWFMFGERKEVRRRREWYEQGRDGERRVRAANPKSFLLRFCWTFLKFCRTWTKQYLITSLKRIKCVPRITTKPSSG